jgi:mannose-6-phosphate isomerase
MDTHCSGGAVRFVPKPWGYEKVWAETERYVGKLLHIQAGRRLSLQFHRLKDETLLLLSGRMILMVGKQGEELARELLEAGGSYHIAPGTIHRMEAVEDCDLVEVSTPELEDVVRLEDDFGREGTSLP